MPQSVRFRHLKKELNRLKKQFLPKINPTGKYTARQLSLTLAYRVLAHAEIESYLEDRAWEVALDAKKVWDSIGETRRSLICLVAFSGQIMDLPPDTLTPKKPAKEVPPEKLRVSEKIKLSVNYFKKVIDNNHGLKEANILALLLPIGIDSNDLDSAWLATMNTFGKERGSVAHSSSGTIQPPDPASELDRVNQITQELLKIDGFINLLMK